MTSSEGINGALQRVREASESARRKHRAAVAWLERVSCPAEIVWLPRGWAKETGDLPSLVSSRGMARILRLAGSGPNGLQIRAHRVMDERAAMQASVRAVLGEIRPFPEGCPASDLFVQYTRLGQPLPGWRGEAAAWARGHHIRLRDVHISFTHDGEAVIALATCAPGLRGAGIDVVRLDRFRGKTRDYLLRFARHFMSPSEHEGFAAASSTESDEATARRAAAHFSLMESASKALGTGLKIGGGMGKPESMRKQSIGVRVSAHGSEVGFELAEEVTARMAALRASRMEGYFSADSEYLVSAVFLSG